MITLLMIVVMITAICILADHPPYSRVDDCAGVTFFVALIVVIIGVCKWLVIGVPMLLALILRVTAHSLWVWL